MIENINITCKDGETLAATLYNATNPKATIMIAPATGIHRRFYTSFATYLAEQDYSVITFDNRGIGDSKTSKKDTDLVAWGRLDMTAVLEELKHRFPTLSYHLIGHSAGGQLVGLMDNALELASMFNFACSSGSLKGMSYPFKFNASFFLNVFIPVSNLLFGKTNSQWVGMGEPLPPKVAQQWSKWCNGKGYIAVDLDKSINTHYYHDIQFPSLWLHATDDGIANLSNVKDMIRVYTNMPSEIISLTPSELGYKDIGHMKFFSSKRKELWQYALDWLEKQKKE